MTPLARMRNEARVTSRAKYAERISFFSFDKGIAERQINIAVPSNSDQEIVMNRSEAI
jgi:hypothetical protein